MCSVCLGHGHSVGVHHLGMQTRSISYRPRKPASERRGDHVPGVGLALVLCAHLSGVPPHLSFHRLPCPAVERKGWHPGPV